MISVEQNLLEIFLKLIFATFLGFLIGLERNLSHKEAGIRTFAIITIGSCLFIILGNDILPQIWGKEGIDPSRTLGQLAVGLGFLGAGMIIFDNKRLRGLTTAAIVWLSAAIGAAVGFGAYFTAVFTTLLALLILSAFLKLEKQFNININNQN